MKNGETYFPQDFIFTTNLDSKPTSIIISSLNYNLLPFTAQKRPTIAQLSSMHETTRGEKYATIRYFYRPEGEVAPIAYSNVH